MPYAWPVVITEEVAYNLWLFCDVCEYYCDCVEAGMALLHIFLYSSMKVLYGQSHAYDMHFTPHL